MINDTYVPRSAKDGTKKERGEARPQVWKEW